jgi:hypothetical protein
MTQRAIKDFLAGLRDSCAELSAVADQLDDAGIPDDQRLDVTVEAVEALKVEHFRMSDELKAKHFRAIRDLYYLIISLKEKDDAAKRALDS